MIKNDAPLPVTVLSGFLGSGKTTLLNHLLRKTTGQRIAVLVNDMSEVNIDASLVIQAREELVELSNGCICCTLRADLLREVARLARSGRFDRILIESTGISEPLPVAQTFTFEEGGEDLRKLTRLESLVTVLDVSGFWSWWKTRDTLADRKMGTGPQDRRPLCDLLVQQVEFADVIILNKMDLADSDTAEKTEKAVRALNPQARILKSSFCQVEADRILGTPLFDYEAAMGLSAWERELNQVHIPESVEFGITHWTYRARRPFHPGRLHDFLRRTPETLLRMKGPVWLATQPEMLWVWHLGGSSKRMEFSGFWYAALKEEYLAGRQEEVLAVWEEPWGDRRQEIVLIGMDQDWEYWRQGLDRCLLTPREMDQGPQVWKHWPDPYGKMRESVLVQMRNHGQDPAKVLGTAIR